VVEQAVPPPDSAPGRPVAESQTPLVWRPALASPADKQAGDRPTGEDRLVVGGMPARRRLADNLPEDRRSAADSSAATDMLAPDRAAPPADKRERVLPDKPLADIPLPARPVAPATALDGADSRVAESVVDTDQEPTCHFPPKNASLVAQPKLALWHRVDSTPFVPAKLDYSRAEKSVRAPRRRADFTHLTNLEYSNSTPSRQAKSSCDNRGCGKRIPRAISRPANLLARRRHLSTANCLGIHDGPYDALATACR
jgi:hypothetical protein